MLYPTKKITLKDGTDAIFRSPTRADAKQMLQYLQTVCSETVYLTREPEETNIPLDKQELFLDNILQSENDIMIACEINGKIIGNCNLNRYSLMRMRHRAGIGVAICKEFWGLGIAGIMLTELTEIAQKLVITQLELEVIGDNERAISLYERFGFYKIGERPNAFLLKDGSVRKEILMIKEIKN